MIIRTVIEAEQFLAQYIPHTSQQKFLGEKGLLRAKYFMQLLGRPQEKLKVIHIAGTSGKGSTCYLISSLLISQGFKVGFHQSPHLTDVRERFQINGKKINEAEFVSYINKIIPLIDQTSDSEYGPPSYFEILVGLAFYIFADKKVNYAVMETGLGGWYDGTNVVSRSDKLSVLTKIGLDHTNILGKTIEKIALQKAMIINKNSQAISIYQDPDAERIIKEVVKSRQAKIFFVEKKEHFNFKLKLLGDYQKENAGLALAVVNYLSQRDGFDISQNKIRETFASSNFSGRFEIKNIKGKEIIFDGAHNPQKMSAFISSLIKRYPNHKFNFLLAFKIGKDYQKMLKIITPVANSIILTNFQTKNQDMTNISERPETVGKALNKDNFKTFSIVNSYEKAWNNVLNTKGSVVITGSLYLIGEIYRLIKKK